MTNKDKLKDLKVMGYIEKINKYYNNQYSPVYENNKVLVTNYSTLYIAESMHPIGQYASGHIESLQIIDLSELLNKGSYREI